MPSRRALRNLPAAIVGVLLAVMIVTGPKAERLGDRFQIALPLLAWGCSAINGHAAEYLLRYAVMFTGLHSVKQGLGDASINRRPNGGSAGMPSGHMATAAFGASTLLHECAMGSAPVRIAVVLAAGFTGASRMDAGAHTIWQVLLGTLWGLACDRALRRHAPARQRIRLQFQRVGKFTLVAVRKLSCHISLPRRLRWS